VYASQLISPLSKGRAELCHTSKQLQLLLLGQLMRLCCIDSADGSGCCSGLR